MKFIVNDKEKLIKSLIHNVQGLSFSSAQKMLRLGKVKLNGKRIKENTIINIGDEIELFEFQKSKPQLPIIYKDENIIIVNKPAGIECATRDKSSNNTYSLEELFEDDGAIVVHRLDRLTEGLVILARNKEVAREFEDYFRTRQVEKFYMAGVTSKPLDFGVKTAYLKKDSKNSKVEISDTFKDGFKEIITEYSLVKETPEDCVLDIKLHTGRTHQIRAYMSHIGCSVIGDTKYGKPNTKYNYSGYFLTAYKLRFNISGKLNYLNKMEFEITPSWINLI